MKLRIERLSRLRKVIKKEIQTRGNSYVVIKKTMKKKVKNGEKRIEW